MGVHFAHTDQATEQRKAKAKCLARWCYDNGLAGRRILATSSETRRKMAHAVGVPPPSEGAAGSAGETWQLVARLLDLRAQWDRDHGRRPPRPHGCIDCVLAGKRCRVHGASSCRICGGALHQVFVETGYDTHPTCDPDQ